MLLLINDLKSLKVSDSVAEQSLGLSEAFGSTCELLCLTSSVAPCCCFSTRVNHSLIDVVVPLTLLLLAVVECLGGLFDT